jgi:predicted transcriptional regulator
VEEEEMKSLTVELNDQEYARFERIAKRQRRTPENMLLYWVDTLLQQDEAYQDQSAAVRDEIREEKVE